ncbi:MAG: glycosyltransferase family 4 protein [Akkermansiaceae bacterium]|nr:glycosyltransferase family 4 protein [Akkermansiaceae bacterium]NNM29765.1 glycosyltransferase family 4 protein [Akkermansiaceae bacterium]
MRATFLTPGTGSYYCGACMRDNALVVELHRAGHEVHMLPMYLPLSLDEESIPELAETPVFFGGINVYLQQKWSLFRKTPEWLDRWLNIPGLLRGAAKRSHMTSARDHGEMCLAMLRIEESGLRKELDKLLDWLEDHGKPEVLCLSTALQAGLIREVKKRLGIPVICFFQGEDSFLDGLPEPYRRDSWEEMGKRLQDADLLVAPSRYYAGLMEGRLGMPAGSIEVLPNGINLEGMGPARPPSGPPVIGYLARMIRDKGLEVLVDAFIALRRDLGHPDCRLAIAGTCTKGDEALVAELKERLDRAGLGEAVEWRPNLSREEKLSFLQGLTLFSVPAVYPEAFGLYVVEALASGVPIVQPETSSFPEFVEATGGGRLVPAGDAQALARMWSELLADPDEIRALGESGRRGAATHYSVAAMKEGFTGMAERVLATEAARRAKR